MSFYKLIRNAFVYFLHLASQRKGEKDPRVGVYPGTQSSRIEYTETKTVVFDSAELSQCLVSLQDILNGAGLLKADSVCQHDASFSVLPSGTGFHLLKVILLHSFCFFAKWHF